jgi:5-methylcytosine-specific restriction endonuclease McrA
MRGMEYLTDRPPCEWPEFVKTNHRFRTVTREHAQGRTLRKRNNDRRSSMDKTGQASRRRQRELILKHYGPLCHICLARGITDQRAVIDLELPWPDLRCFTRDHVTPRSLGGSDDIANLRPAHHECNRDRGNGPVIYDQAGEDSALAFVYGARLAVAA